MFPPKKKKGPMPPAPSLDIVVGVGKPKPGAEKEPPVKDEEEAMPKGPMKMGQLERPKPKAPPVEKPPVEEPPEPEPEVEAPPVEPPVQDGEVEGGEESLASLGEKYGLRPEEADNFVADFLSLVRRKLTPEPVEEPPVVEE